MNRDEVIRILGETQLSNPLRQAAFVAIEDIKKQIPRKPINKDAEGYRYTDT